VLNLPESLSLRSSDVAINSPKAASKTSGSFLPSKKFFRMSNSLRQLIKYLLKFNLISILHASNTILPLGYKIRKKRFFTCPANKNARTFCLLLSLVVRMNFIQLQISIVPSKYPEYPATRTCEKKKTKQIFI